MKIKLPKLHSNNKVELYFVIYLSTIVGFFTIESELKRYQKSQNEILLEVARKEINQLINVNDLKRNDKLDTLIMEMKLEGDYDKNNIFPILSFSFLDTIKDSLFKTETELKKLNNHKENNFIVSISKEEFGEYKGKAMHAELSIDFIPLITQDTKTKWNASFGSEKVVNKIVKNIYDKVREDGKFNINKNLGPPITPIEGFVKDFYITFDETSYSVLKGINWEIPLIISGVDRVKDLIIDVIEGTALINKINKDYPRTTINGIGRNSGKLTIRGTRSFDGKSSTKSININVFDPQWELPALTNEFYIGENHQFDARIKGIANERVSVSVKSDMIKKGIQSYLYPIIELGPFDKEGRIDLDIIVDGTSLKELKSTLYVKKPPAPDINIVRIGSTNNIEISITIYGKENKIKTPILWRGGLTGKSSNPFSTKKEENFTIYKFSAIISKPSSSINTQEVSFIVRDKYGEKSFFEQTYEYYK